MLNKYYFLVLSLNIYASSQAQLPSDALSKAGIPTFPDDTSWVRMKKSFDTSVQSHNWREAAAFSNSIANLHLAKFRYDEAITYQKIALQYAVLTGDKKIELICHYNIGNSYFKNFKYPEAMEYLLKALKLTEGTDDPEAMVKISNGIGIIYKYLEDYDRALAYLLPALKHALQLKQGPMPDLYVNIGNSEEKLGNYPESIRYYSEYMQRWPSQTQVQVVGYDNLGSAYLKMDKTDSAEACFLKAYNMDDTLKNPRGRAYSYYYFSQIAQARGDYAKAVFLLKKA